MVLNTFEDSIYINRRSVLSENIGKGKVLLLGNRESSINFADNWYPFRQDSTFLYYAGLNIPDIDIIIDTATGKTILFGDELSIEHIIWTGPLPTVKEMASQVGIQEIKPSSELKKYIDKETLFIPPYRGEHELRLASLFDGKIKNIKKGSSILIDAIIKQRNYKSQVEIDSLHEACTLTSKMHYEVMANAKPGMYEYELVGIAKTFAANHNTHFSFQPICTTRGHVLHNHSYDNKIDEGDMVLYDGGVESRLLYAGDMTRTFPVSRKFNAKQADLYQIVLNCQKAAIQMAKVGNKFLDIHLHSAKTLVKGLADLGIMKGDPEEAVSQGAHTMFFQCGLGHLMGLDVHDMENLGEQSVGYGEGMIKSKEFGLKSLRLGRKLEEGFVITIEPGIYIIPELIDKFSAEKKYLNFIDYKELNKYRNFGGIRIEDDYLIKEEGIELLGEPLIKEVKEIEHLRSNI